MPSRRAKMLVLTLCGVLGVAILAGVLLQVSRIHAEQEIQRTIAMSWGDGKYGPKFYGARVYTRRDAGMISVRAQILIGPGNGMYHDCGELGRVQTHAAAAQQWGIISWKPEGVYIGIGGSGDYFVPRNVFESHR
jgi:hypothetical protein